MTTGIEVMINRWETELDDYARFVRQKRVTADAVGFVVDEQEINQQLFPFQRAIVRWALQRGRAALFEDCGLGKTPQQLEWSRHVAMRTGRPVLILAPLAVAAQTKREGDKFGIPVTICRSQADVRPGVNVANYEMLEHLEPTAFGGVVLDESSILKSYMGKTKQRLVEAFSATPYRLCCTATPAPNDHMELGNHSAFLGIMPSAEMLTRWFINDTERTGVYRLKGHAERDFYEWISSWAVAMRRPSDLGYSDEGYDLPPLVMHQITVPVDLIVNRGDQLFRTPTLSATTLHREMRLTAPDRAAALAEVVNDHRTEPWSIWCHTDYEADELMARLPDAVEVRGSHSVTQKERALAGFSDGSIRVLVSKPSICGFGLNWQHCSHTAFVGLSYSFEQQYQALKRLHRFGQPRPVQAYIVAAETEGQILATIQAKMEAHERMMTGMNTSRDRLDISRDNALFRYDPRQPMTVPQWLQTWRGETA